MPQDTLGDLLDQLAFGHWFGWISVVLGGELPARFFEQWGGSFPAPNLVHIPALILPSPPLTLTSSLYNPPLVSSAPSQPQCSRYIPETGEKMSIS